MSRITGDELDKLWKVSAGLQTLDYEGTTVEIRIDGDGIHYVVNGSELECHRLKAYRQETVQAFRVRVTCQWDNGFWPPE
jgi:hypothetical protein